MPDTHTRTSLRRDLYGETLLAVPDDATHTVDFPFVVVQRAAILHIDHAELHFIGVTPPVQREA